MTDKRNRRSREEMLAYYDGKAAKIRAQIEGTYSDDQESDVLKALKRRHRKTVTALKAARITLNGITGKDGKGWTRAPIAEKIRTTEARLEAQHEAMQNAEEFNTVLPFNVDTLSALIAAAKLGDVVDFPTDLHPLSQDEPKTDEEIEADFIAEN